MREEPPWRKRQEAKRQEPKRPAAPAAARTPAVAPQASNIRADVIWVLHGSSGGVSAYEIEIKIAQDRRIKYSEAKILHVLEMLERDGRVEKNEAEGRTTYSWKVEAV